LFLTAAADNNFRLADCAAAECLGCDDSDPCPACRAWLDEAERRARDASAVVEYRFYEGVIL
jgi:hypothetical protein